MLTVHGGWIFFSPETLVFYICALPHIPLCLRGSERIRGLLSRTPFQRENASPFRLSLDTLAVSPLSSHCTCVRDVCVSICVQENVCIFTLTRVCHTCATVKPNLFDEMHESGPRLNFISSLCFRLFISFGTNQAAPPPPAAPGRLWRAVCFHALIRDRPFRPVFLTAAPFNGLSRLLHRLL